MPALFRKSFPVSAIKSLETDIALTFTPDRLTFFAMSSLLVNPCSTT